MDGGPSPKEAAFSALANSIAEKNRHVMARLACAYCTDLEKNKLPIPSYAVKWWEQHQKDDAIRIAREKEMKRIVKARISALSKLNPDEKKALGLTFPLA
jgi:hypothetical protein